MLYLKNFFLIVLTVYQIAIPIDKIDCDYR